MFERLKDLLLHRTIDREEKRAEKRVEKSLAEIKTKRKYDPHEGYVVGGAHDGAFMVGLYGRWLPWPEHNEVYWFDGKNWLSRDARSLRRQFLQKEAP